MFNKEILDIPVNLQQGIIKDLSVKLLNYYYLWVSMIQACYMQIIKKI